MTTHAEAQKKRAQIARYCRRHTAVEAAFKFKVDVSHVFGIIKEFGLVRVKGYAHGKK